MFQRQRADGILGLQAGGRTRDTTRHVRDAPETRPREPVLPPRPSSSAAATAALGSCRRRSAAGSSSSAPGAEGAVVTTPAAATPRELSMAQTVARSCGHELGRKMKERLAMQMNCSS